MKKWKKRILLTLLIAFALNFSNAATITTQAASKNVTAQYKKPVSKMLKKFDLYFGYSFGKGMKFKYDSIRELQWYIIIICYPFMENLLIMPKTNVLQI